LKNEQLLEEMRNLFSSFDKDLDDQSKDIAFVKGVITEMQRHNGRVIKVLAGVITALLGIIAWIIAT
jgi:hypothetical protein